MNGVNADVQRLEPGALIELYELDLTRWISEVLRFHAHEDGGIIKWNGHEYHAFPMQVSGFGRTGDAAQPTPMLSVANLDGLISHLCMRCDDMVGAPLRRRRTLGQYLDGNPSADPTAEMPVELWHIEQKTLETHTVVEFALSSALDLSGRKLPARQIIGSVCQWIYRGPECGYKGPPYFTRNNVPTTNEKEDACGRRLACCRCRHATESVLPFGGFPAAGVAGSFTRR
ncbi:phage minor tail protein L [Caballeronia sp. LZ035]|uniref:phage minor tail protein L n=1 Tax=Caballeronia sp. LZ035 TaxID=3038568 RepID=UPI002854CD2C|nr:phage minor tail protein L [Caballeronia sp. LZ035]MDR5756507.1 phage minor tail protein L [Caballeronia sp. LZ035]